MAFSNPNLIFASSTIDDGNMTLLRGDKNDTIKNRQKFLKKLNINPKDVVVLSLEHDTTVLIANEKDKGKNIFEITTPIHCDAMITNQKNLFLFLVTGDCLPIAFYDPIHKAIALVHASRKNMVNGIIKKVVKKLEKTFKTDPQNIIVKIGPSIGPCCYHKKLSETFRFREKVLQPFIFEKDSRIGTDLWGLVESLLINEGIKKQNMDNPQICTYHSGKYFSHRKFEENNLEFDARFATILGIQNGR